MVNVKVNDVISKKFSSLYTITSVRKCLRYRRDNQTSLIDEGLLCFNNISVLNRGRTNNFTMAKRKG